LSEEREQPYVAQSMDAYFTHLNDAVNKKQSRAEQRRSIFMLTGPSNTSSTLGFPTSKPNQ